MSDVLVRPLFSQELVGQVLTDAREHNIVASEKQFMEDSNAGFVAYRDFHLEETVKKQVGGLDEGTRELAANQAKVGFSLAHRAIRCAFMNSSLLMPLMTMDDMLRYETRAKKPNVLRADFIEDYRAEAAVRRLVFSGLQKEHTRRGAMLMFEFVGDTVNPGRPPRNLPNVDLNYLLAPRTASAIRGSKSEKRRLDSILGKSLHKK
jgi:hypothetical protein